MVPFPGVIEEECCNIKGPPLLNCTDGATCDIVLATEGSIKHSQISAKYTYHSSREDLGM
jgi:hypothetical protein